MGTGTAEQGRAAKGDLALVMSGGGARAAYQVGFLRSLARSFPSLEAPILTGVSAGAINAAYLASRTERFTAKVDGLASLWEGLEVEDVFRAGTLGLFAHALRWGVRLVSGGRLFPVGGMVDTEPLRGFLRRALDSPDGELAGIERNIEAKRLRAVAITTASYTTGQSVTWVQGSGIEEWKRAHRASRSCRLTVEHVMASAALPVFFPAVGIADEWHGDGGMRLTAPLAPAVHLGADRILAISTRRARSPKEASERIVEGYPPPAQVVGQVMNSIFLDQFDGDALSLQRINDLIDRVPPEARGGLRKVELLVLRPSQDLGKLANEHEARLPKMFRHLTRGLGTREARSNDFLSLVMFQGDYLRRLIELGERDGEARRDEVAQLLRSEEESRTETAP